MFLGSSVPVTARLSCNVVTRNRRFLAVCLALLAGCLTTGSCFSNDVLNYCNTTKSSSPVWICDFSVDSAALGCKSSSDTFINVSSSLDLHKLTNRAAFINISACSSNIPYSLPPHRLAEFENFIIFIDVEGEEEHKCPDVHVLENTLKRINHQAKCLALFGITQRLIDSTNNFNRFDVLKEISVANSTLSRLSESFYSFIKTSTSLSKLTVRNTHLERFNLTYRNFNQTLTYIDVSNNKLTGFFVDKTATFPNADLVNISNNRLHSAPQYLPFDHTKTVVDLSICSLRNLGNLVGQMLTLDLSHNNIAEISNSTFTQVHSLSYLDLSFNSLTDLPNVPLGAHLGLLELNLSHNRISQIQDKVFANSSVLERLDLSFNSLTTLSEKSLNLAKLPMLKKLCLHNNRLTSVMSVEPFVDVFFISLSWNRLESLSILPTKFNRNLTVVARHNRISNFKKMNTAMFDLVSRHDHLGVWDPSLMPSWVSSSKRYMSVDLSSNLISTLDAHSLMANLVIRPSNHFGVESFYNISNNTLECNCELHNRVRYLKEAFEVSSEHNIELVKKQVRSILDMNCTITSRSTTVPGTSKVAYVPLEELGDESRKRQLKCSDDAATCPNECFCFFDKKAQLKKADCAECDCLHSMPLIMPKDTYVVDLKYNFIKVFSCKEYLRTVRQLYLEGNLIDSIEDCVYRYLQNVTYIRLDSNYITKFPYQLAYVNSLTQNESVNLANNSFICECSDDVRNGFLHLGSRLVSPEKIECHLSDGASEKYLKYLKKCFLHESEYKTPSGVQVVLLIVVSAIVTVVLIIITIVVYNICCVHYLSAIRRNVAKVAQRFCSARSSSNDRTGNNHGVYNRNLSRRSINHTYNRDCFQRLRDRFQFSPLVDEVESNDGDNIAVHSEEAEFSLTAAESARL